jgi:hypothetical protein
MRAGERPDSLFGMNVLAGLAEGVVDAVLERDEPERDPFAMALQRYRASGAPGDLFGAWRAGAAPRSGRREAEVLRKLDRDLLVGVVGYATTRPSAVVPEAADEAPAGPTLGVIGDRGAMPALEMGSDGTWHVAERAPTADARRAADKTKASVPTLASRYVRPRLPDRY